VGDAVLEILKMRYWNYCDSSSA